MEDIYLKIVVVSNISFEPYFITYLKSKFSNKTDVFTILYGEHAEPKYMKELAYADIVIVWLNFEALFPDVWNTVLFYNNTDQEMINSIVRSCELLFIFINNNVNGKILWFLYEEYFLKENIVLGNSILFRGLIDKINEKMIEILSGDSNTLAIDLKRLIAEVGICSAYDIKGKNRWNAPYSKLLVEAAAKEIHKQYLIDKGITKKCLVLDCDNVLWGGIISEGGIDNIRLGGSGLGRSYKDFQRFMLSLHYYGVIIAICSKNDLSDIMFLFHQHSEMILKEKHIACFQVNWNNKPDNIKKIAERLNISLDSMVFIDDSLIEIEAVKAMIPEVLAIHYNRNTIYDQLSCFNLRRRINRINIEKRNETYRTNQSRDALKNKFDNYNDYLKALETKIDIHEASSSEYSRISELSQRTNKCTNGKRYTVAEIRERVKTHKIILYSLYLSDKLSDLGLVGSFEVESDSLTFFCLSCRALGREIEELMMEYISNRYNICNIIFSSTYKNDYVKDFLTDKFPNAVLSNY